MNWLLIITIAYLLNAIAAVVDKYLLSRNIPQPAVYAFFISFLGLVALVLAPFGFAVPAIGQIIIALLSGLAFTFALLYLFKALKQNDASRITPFIGGWQPLFVFILALLFLGEQLSYAEVLAFFLLIAGTVLITIDFNKKKTGRACPPRRRSGFGLALISAVLFAISYVLTKEVYTQQPFIAGFIWTRFGAFAGALLLLIPPANRRAILASFKKPEQQQKKTGLLFIGGQTAGALSFLLVNYAISLASVSLVNALQGLQYVFLLAIVFFLAKFHPKVLREKMTKPVIWQKVGAIVLVGAGLAILAFA